MFLPRRRPTRFGLRVVIKEQPAFRPVVPPDRFMPLADQIRDLGVGVAFPRINLDGLVPPASALAPAKREPDAALSATSLTVEEARKVLRATQMEAAHARIRESGAGAGPFLLFHYRPKPSHPPRILASDLISLNQQSAAGPPPPEVILLRCSLGSDLNIHGIVTVDSAMMLEEDVAVPISSANEAPKDTTKMDTDDAPSDPVSGADVNVHEPDTTEAAPAAENGAENPEEKSVPMETDAKKAVEKEYEMALQDRVMEETKEKKNVVEAYVYDMRNKLYDRYNDFVTPEEKEGLIGKLREVEDWLYEDDW
ncbi:Heat shock protein 14 [Zea mays]|uniref:Heat shock protein 14 n=1 Tax=Zea mays TaxID=4577 RepID=A0A3L6FH65_MAIZE|nr:Heat shock protein 14 [Zea mays]